MKHASIDELADLSAGTLRRRKATRISAHVAQCARCARTSNELAGVPALLASVSYPPIPDHLAMRIDAAVAAEASVRIATSPATEAGRGALPVRSRRRAGERSGWLPHWSPALSRRMVAAAAAVAAVGAAGGYGLSRAGAPPVTRSSAAAPAVMRPASQLTYGPTVSYGHHEFVEEVSSSTDFVPSKLSSEVRTAVADARQGGVAAAQAMPAPNAGIANNTASVFSPVHGTTTTRLGGCVGKLAASAQVLLVEEANFNGRPATVVVVAAATRPGAANVWVVGMTCSAADTHVLDHALVTHI